MVMALTSWLRLTWQSAQRSVTADAPPHDSVYARFAVSAVLQYDSVLPYRPEGLRRHAKLADYYKDIPIPPVQTGLLGYIKSFFLTS